ncbi:hypothetical protein GCM10010330_42020 [Streptomyces tendae]|nr:hypothetical protein GCM10010330_42020 [Streptomyces tendae]
MGGGSRRGSGLHACRRLASVGPPLAQLCLSARSTGSCTVGTKESQPHVGADDSAAPLGGQGPCPAAGPGGVERSVANRRAGPTACFRGRAASRAR